jgi:hypothetical protein
VAKAPITTEPTGPMMATPVEPIPAWPLNNMPTKNSRTTVATTINAIRRGVSADILDLSVAGHRIRDKRRSSAAS